MTTIRPEEFALCRNLKSIIEEAAIDWPPEIIAGIISRESRFGLLLDAEGKGDHGHGFGLCQRLQSGVDTVSF